MPFPFASNPRRLMHRRAIDVQVFAREDGRFDVEARLIDTKTREVVVGGAPRAAGDPLHEMVLGLVIDAELTIHAAGSATLAMPYSSQCEQHGDAYAQLAGLNLLHGFRAAAKQRLAGTRGCTHLTELCNVLPTAVIQALAGEVLDTQEGADRAAAASDLPPFQLDRCHALRRDGPVVQAHYPRWYRPAAPADAVPPSAS